MNKNIIKILVSMGYRQLKPDIDKWAKPVGYSILTFDYYEPEEEWQITCWCPVASNSVNDKKKYYRWSTKAIDIDNSDAKELKDDFLYKENAVMYTQWNYGDFSFLTTKDFAEIEMDSY